MGKLIYLVSLLGSVDKLSFVLSWVTIPLTVFIICGYVVSKPLEDEGKIKKDIAKIISKGIFVFVISIITTVFIPSKEEMYIIALTKDYDKEELYQMSKDEIKDGVDYVFDKLEGLKND